MKLKNNNNNNSATQRPEESEVGLNGQLPSCKPRRSHSAWKLRSAGSWVYDK